MAILTSIEQKIEFNGDYNIWTPVGYSNARYFFEDHCDLMINLNDDGKASEVYLDVNY